MKKIDEGLATLIAEFPIKTVIVENCQYCHLESARKLVFAIQSYLKKEGWAKLPGKYVVKKGCLVKID